MEEIPLGEEVLVDTFFLYEHPIIILFDSGASYDFLSLACAQKAGVTLYATQVPYSISLARKIPLEPVGGVFSTTLIILESQRIDVILDMNGMKMHQVVLDISARLVHLNSPIYGKVSLQLPPVAHL
jgi:hypothetical protein